MVAELLSAFGFEKHAKNDFDLRKYILDDVHESFSKNWSRSELRELIESLDLNLASTVPSFTENPYGMISFHHEDRGFKYFNMLQICFTRKSQFRDGKLWECCKRILLTLS